MCGYSVYGVFIFKKVYCFINHKIDDGGAMEYDNLTETPDNSTFGMYVYLTAMVTSLFDSKQIYEDLAHYYS